MTDLVICKQAVEADGYNFVKGAMYLTSFINGLQAVGTMGKVYATFGSDALSNYFDYVSFRRSSGDDCCTYQGECMFYET